MRGRWFDGLIGLALFGGALAAYAATLAPTVLDGDAALFQYTPQVLGVTYPTGYPVYLLLSKVWLSLFPFGQVAWRMNLFSALCASLALPIFYDVARRVWHSRWAALTSVLIYATLPTYWLWATEAKIYALNILLYSMVLWLALAEGQGSRGAGEQGSRGAGEQGSRGKGEQGSRGAGEQGSRGAGEQGSRGAGEQGKRRLTPYALRPTAYCLLLTAYCLGIVIS